MPFHLPGGGELIIVAGIILLLFGGAKLPQLMKGLGEGMREFKKATRDEDEPRSASLPPSTTSTTNNEPRV